MSVAERDVDTTPSTSVQPMESTSPPLLEAPIRPRRRWPWVALGVVLGAAAALVVERAAGEPGSATATEDESAVAALVESATATVTRQDLIEEVEWDGQLGFGDEQVVSGSGGTVTATAEVGTVIERGDVLLSVDGHPLVAFYGSTPPYRTLAQGMEGADVQQLETNLVALGYDPEGTVTIDDEFTDYTEAMVERWQEDLGSEVTGSVEVGHIAVLDGPSLVRSSADPGAAATGPLVTVAATSLVTDSVDDGFFTGSSEQGLLAATVVVDVADADEFTIGDSVVIEQVDESLLAGSVEDVGAVVTTTADGISTVEITVAVEPDPTEGSVDPIEGQVVIHTIGSQVLDAMVVPTRSLVSLREGGFAVEKVSSVGRSSLVGIELGVFDDGMVEVTSVTEGSLSEGDEIVVPQ